MALLRNSLLAGIVAAAAWCSTPVLADDSTITDRTQNDHRSDYLDDNYIYDYMTHRDTITVGLGDATTSNNIIQHPTPWPWYINKTKIETSGAQGISALNNMMQQYSSGGAAPASNTAGTNLTDTTSAGMTSASGN